MKSMNHKRYSIGLGRSLLVFFVCSQSLCGFGTLQLGAQDPTAPSQQMIERLQSKEQPIAQSNTLASVPSREPLPKIPELRLKAIVMGDPDRGTAILFAGEQRIVVKLNRKVAGNTISKEEELLEGFTVAGVFFHVESFSSRSLLLRVQPHDVALVVQ